MLQDNKRHPCVGRQIAKKLYERFQFASGRADPYNKARKLSRGVVGSGDLLKTVQRIHVRNVAKNDSRIFRWDVYALFSSS